MLQFQAMSHEVRYRRDRRNRTRERSYADGPCVQHDKNTFLLESLENSFGLCVGDNDLNDRVQLMIDDL